MRKNKEILVIGSAHIDILGDFKESYNSKQNIYKEGEIFIGIGGVGYNIAVNLKCHNYNVKLFTVVQANSFSGDLIEKAFDKTGLDKSLLHKKEINTSIETGFVGLRMNGDLKSGVTSTFIDQFSFDDPYLEDIITKFDVVVIDCNLNNDQINQIQRISHENEIPVFVCSVSETRVKNALFSESEKKYWYKVFCLNSKEANKSLEHHSCLNTWDVKNANDIKSLCEFFHSENIIITNNVNGYSIFSPTGGRKDFPRHEIAGQIYDLGAGDALFSAVVAHYTRNNSFNWDICNLLIGDFLKKVLKSRGANPDINSNIKAKNKKNILGEPFIENNDKKINIDRNSGNINIIMGSGNIEVINSEDIQCANTILKELDGELSKIDSMEISLKEDIREIIKEIKIQINDNRKVERHSFRSLFSLISGFTSLSSFGLSLGKVLGFF